MSHFLHQISLANEALEEESELDQVTQEYKDEKVLEELMRCELLKVERNPIAWESLNKLVRFFLCICSFKRNSPILIRRRTAVPSIIGTRMESCLRSNEKICLGKEDWRTGQVD
jgi:hypothetical protein